MWPGLLRNFCLNCLIIGLTGVTALCPWARHINPRLVLVQPRHKWKMVDCEVKNQMKQTDKSMIIGITEQIIQNLSIRQATLSCHRSYCKLDIELCIHSTLHMLFNFVCFFRRLQFFFLKINIFKNSFRNTIRVSISLDLDEALHLVRPGLDPNCLQRLSAH